MLITSSMYIRSQQHQWMDTRAKLVLASVTLAPDEATKRTAHYNEELKFVNTFKQSIGMWQISLKL